VRVRVCGGKGEGAGRGDLSQLIGILNRLLQCAVEDPSDGALFITCSSDMCCHGHAHAHAHVEINAPLHPLIMTTRSHIMQCDVFSDALHQ